MLQGLKQCSDIDEEVFAFPGPLARQVIHFLDGIGLAPSRIRRYAAIAHNVAGRENYFPAASEGSGVLSTFALEGLPGRETQSTASTVSRLDGAKRVRLIDGGDAAC